MGALGLTKSSRSGGAMWGGVGPVIILVNRIHLPLNIMLEIKDNFWRTPKYHHLGDRWYGEWPPARGFAILQFFHPCFLKLNRYFQWSSFDFPKILKMASGEKWFTKRRTRHVRVKRKTEIYFSLKLNKMWRAEPICSAFFQIKNDRWETDS